MFWKAHSFITAQPRTSPWKRFFPGIYTDYDSIEKRCKWCKNFLPILFYLSNSYAGQEELKQSSFLKGACTPLSLGNTTLQNGGRNKSQSTGNWGIAPQGLHCFPQRKVLILAQTCIHSAHVLSQFFLYYCFCPLVSVLRNLLGKPF